MVQPVGAQEPAAGGTGGVGSVAATRDEPLRVRFERLLLAVPTLDLAAGWQLAADIGRPAVPLLWEILLAEESNVGRRLVLLVAVMLAGGTAEDEQVFKWLGQPAPRLEERSMAGFMMALGPRRSRPIADFWSCSLGPQKPPAQVLAIAARLAAARFPGTEAGAPVLSDDDPGLAAATAYAGLPLLPSVSSRLWDLKNPADHAGLFWRGALLASVHQANATRPAQDPMLHTAREVIRLIGDHHGAARGAAALFLARRGQVRCDGARPDWRLLQLLASDQAAAVELQPWLQAVPMLEEPERLAVAYVLSRDPSQVVAQRDVWGADQRIHRHVAVALAWRLLGEERPQLVEASLSAVPEWFFVRWASGAGTARDGVIEDATLETAAGLAIDQRLPRGAARNVLEEALWRWGSHPGLGLLENDRLLVRDLLLVGSNLGGGKYVTHVPFEHRYRPTGIGSENAFFDIAVAAYDFLSRPRLPLPPEYRLR